MADSASTADGDLYSFIKNISEEVSRERRNMADTLSGAPSNPLLLAAIAKNGKNAILDCNQSVANESLAPLLTVNNVSAKLARVLLAEKYIFHWYFSLAFLVALGVAVR